MMFQFKIHFSYFNTVGDLTFRGMEVGVLPLSGWLFLPSLGKLWEIIPSIWGGGGLIVTWNTMGGLAFYSLGGGSYH